MWLGVIWKTYHYSESLTEYIFVGLYNKGLVCLTGIAGIHFIGDVTNSFHNLSCYDANFDKTFFGSVPVPPNSKMTYKNREKLQKVLIRKCWKMCKWLTLKQPLWVIIACKEADSPSSSNCWKVGSYLVSVQCTLFHSPCRCIFDRSSIVCKALDNKAIGF